jgi:hypothetical protein
MENQKLKRPVPVTLLSILVSLMALSQICSQAVIIQFRNTVADPKLQSIVDSWSFFDYISPFILAGLAIISMALFFLLRKSALTWFLIYLGLLLLTTIQQALTTTWLEHYGMQGVLSSAGGFLLLTALLGYMLWLKKRGVLR